MSTVLRHENKKLQKLKAETFFLVNNKTQTDFLRHHSVLSWLPVHFDQSTEKLELELEWELTSQHSEGAVLVHPLDMPKVHD